MHLRILQEIDYENIYFINVEMSLVESEKYSKLSNWVKKVVTFVIVTSISLINNFTSLINYVKNKILNKILNNLSIELKFFNNIIIYENKLKK